MEFFSPSHLDSSSPVKRESVARIDYFPDGYVHRSDDHQQKHVNSSHRRHLQQSVTSKSTSSQSRFRQSSQVKSSQSTRLCRTNDHYRPTPAMKKAATHNERTHTIQQTTSRRGLIWQQLLQLRRFVRKRGGSPACLRKTLRFLFSLYRGIYLPTEVFKPGTLKKDYARF